MDEESGRFAHKVKIISIMRLAFTAHLLNQVRGVSAPVVDVCR